MRSESPTDAIVSANVSTAGSQRPSAAKAANALAVPRAARRPPKRRTVRMPSAAVPTQVSLKKNVVSQPTRLSRKLAMPLKIVKKRLGFSTLRLSESHAWKLSRWCGRVFHVSAAGHGTSFRQPMNAIAIPAMTNRTRKSRFRHHARAA
jgi:hypothetical protein